MSIPNLTTKDQANIQQRPPSSKGRKRIKLPVDVLPYYATHTNAPTLADVQEAAVRSFARLLVAYFAEQGQGGVA